MAGESYPWLEPTTKADQRGLVSHVTFVEVMVHLRETWLVYHGQSDLTLAVATHRLGETYGGSR